VGFRKLNLMAHEKSFQKLFGRLLAMKSNDLSELPGLPGKVLRC